MKEEIVRLEHEIREEKRLLLENMQRIWRKPLPERVEAGRALGGLEIVGIDGTKGVVYFRPPAEDFAFFQQHAPVRISRNAPEDDFVRAYFHGLTDQGLAVATARADGLALLEKTGWSIDEDFVDVSGYYLRAVEEMAQTAHGQDKVFAALFGEVDADVSTEVYEDVCDALEAEKGLNESQADAVATALASEPFHLVQGPPGTGKTHALARLVDQLQTRGNRILVTAFTHRAIHNALEKIRGIVGEDCPVVKVSRPMPGDDALPFPVYASFADSGLQVAEGPYVVGATPFSLFSSRLDSAKFDAAVIDETSQMNVPSAVMAMLRADRWYFFGDHRQLPPVSMVHAEDPSLASVFSRLARQKQPSTLNVTYRMNEPLTRWPSEQFYSGQLRSHFPGNRLPLKSNIPALRRVLDPEKPLVSLEIDSPGCKSRNDEEADVAAEIILALLESGVEAEEIGVVSPFRAQASRVRTLLAGARFSTRHPKLARRITVDTVDRFQGQEREVILYTFTTSDGAFINKLRDFLLMPPRLNVAVTRARTKVVLLHSPELREFAESGCAHHEASDIFLTLLRDAEAISI